MVIVDPLRTATRMSSPEHDGGYWSAGGYDDQRRAMIRSLSKPSLEQHATAATMDVSHLMMGRMNVLNDMSLPQHRFLMMQLAEQSRVNQLLNENFALGLMDSHYHQLVPPHDDLTLMAQQLQQHQQQFQLQQQQELLLQAGQLAEAAASGAIGIERGIAAGNLEALGLLDLSSATHTASIPRSPGFEDTYDGNPGYSGVTSQRYNQSHFPIQINSDSDHQSTMKRRGESFPMVLLRILSDLEAAGSSDIACFVAGGDAFLIRSPKAFEDSVLPRYFPRMGSFGSFQRQLNLYDFRRISEGHHRGAYTHPLFRRHMPMLSKEMKRTKIKGSRNNVKKVNGSEEA